MSDLDSAVVLVEIYKTKMQLSYKLDLRLLGRGSYIGALVLVPLGRSLRTGIIVKVIKDGEAFVKGAGYNIRLIDKILYTPWNVSFVKFIKTLKTLYQTSFSHFYFGVFEVAVGNKIVKRGLDSKTNNLVKKRKKSASNIFRRLSLQRSLFSIVRPKKLLPQQEEALEKIFQIVGQGNSFVQILLHGRTGSGKTEIYKALIKKQLDSGKSVVWLFPEVWLCQRTFSILKSWFSQCGIAVHIRHCKSTQGQRKALLEDLLHGKPIVIMGVQLPIFMPISNLGMIIVDEEHESSYQGQSLPRVNIKQAAILLSKELSIPIILGSATPSVDSIYKVERGLMHCVSMPSRVFHSNVQLLSVNLLKEAPRKHFWVSTLLANSISQRLECKEQCIIFINRRGYNRMAICSNCQTPVFCNNCSKALTIHYKTNSASQGICHDCLFAAKIDRCCKKCAGTLDFKGIGTKRVAEIVQELFPQSRVMRVDADCSKGVGFESQLNESDIIVGTQSVAKSIDLPRVSLVAFLFLDLDFNMPFFNSTELAVQRMLQLSGRNRGKIPGVVLAQTFASEHFSFSINENNYLDFCKQELELRQALGLPPVSKRYNVNVSDYNQESLTRFNLKLKEALEVFNKNCLDRASLDLFCSDVFLRNKRFVQDNFLTGNSFAQIIEFLNISGLKEFALENGLSFSCWPVF